jgi:hypothetical protein
MPLAEVLAVEVFGPAAMTDTAYPGAKESLATRQPRSLSSVAIVPRSS